MNTMQSEIAKHGIILNNITYSMISNKDGIIVARIKSEDKSVIFKYFESQKHRREIFNYKMLHSMNIKTINVINFTERSILMEDISTSIKYRLASKEDLKKEEVIIALAEWYKELHSKGKEYFKRYPNTHLYSEIEELDEESILFIREKSSYENELFWDNLIKYIPSFIEFHKQNRTFTYNDFYYTNLALKRDYSESFMFDYNLLGEGLVYSDIRNVISSLDDKMSELFLSTYGSFNKYEKMIDDITGPIFTLLCAYKRERFPQWAKSELDKLKSGELHNLLDYMSREQPLN